MLGEEKCERTSHTSGELRWDKLPGVKYKVVKAHIPCGGWVVVYNSDSGAKK